MIKDGTSADIFRERLKNARELRGYSQEELAKRDREIAKDFLEMLAKRKARKEKDE